MVYLDYASTTPVDEEVFEVMKDYFRKFFGNPSSIHKFGQLALKAVDESRFLIKQLIHADYFNEIIFTSSATESNNLVLKGLVYFFNFKLKIKPHIITTEIEHPSIIETLADLKSNNLVEIDFLPLDHEGCVYYQILPQLIKENTCLVSVHYVNSEIGIIQPIKKISQIIQELNNRRELKIYFHTDASQAPLTEEISVKETGVDLMTLSSHKIYGPKGIACLYKKNNIILEKLISGSEQEFNLRAGTENVPLIVGFSQALKLAIAKREIYTKHFAEIREYFLTKLNEENIDFKINGNLSKTTPRIINLYFPNKSSQEMLLYLDQNEIYVSMGPACQSRAVIPNYVVNKLYPERANNSLRFSFGKETTKNDIDYVVKKISFF